MSNRAPSTDSDRRKSDVLDAIYEAVEHAAVSGEDSPTFEARALEQIDVSAQVDKALPLISRSTWVALVGVALVIVAGLVYSAGVVQVSAVNAVGRAVAAPGIALAVSPVDAVISKVLIGDGDSVAQGQLLATGTTAQGTSVDVVAPVDGTVWQQLAFAGQTLSAGESVASILPPGSDQMVMVAVPESQMAEVAAGLSVDSSVGTGKVTSVNAAPTPADLAGELLGINLQAAEPVVLVTVGLDTPVEPGSIANARIIISEQTLLGQLMRLR